MNKLIVIISYKIDPNSHLRIYVFVFCPSSGKFRFSNTPSTNNYQLKMN
jgi:hypothetical protein